MIKEKGTPVTIYIVTLILCMYVIFKTIVLKNDSVERRCYKFWVGYTGEYKHNILPLCWLMMTVSKM